MSEYTYWHTARVVRILDADTFDLRIDLGYFISLDARVRLEGVSAPEKHTKAGKKATKFVAKRMPIDSLVWVQVARDPEQSFARYIGRVWLPKKQQWLGELLVAKGHARHGAFMG